MSDVETKADKPKYKIRHKAKRPEDLTNPIFKKNIVDPRNGKFVKRIWLKKKMKDTKFKKNREKFDLVWQYYRDRGRQSVENILKKYNNHYTIKIIYFNDPIEHIQELTPPNTEKKIIKEILDDLIDNVINEL